VGVGGFADRIWISIVRGEILNVGGCLDMIPLRSKNKSCSRLIKPGMIDRIVSSLSKLDFIVSLKVA